MLVLVCATEAGGAGNLVPIIEYSCDTTFIVYADKGGIPIFAAAKLSYTSCEFLSDKNNGKEAALKLLSEVKPDLILCGRQAIDDDMAQIGPALAVYLNIPCITVMTHLEFAHNWEIAKVTRQIEGGSETIESPLPALFTCQKGLNQPRLPSLRGIMTAKKKEIQIFNAEKIGFVPNIVSDATSTALQTGMALPSSRDKGTIFDGLTNEAVSKLVKALREKEKVV